MMCIYKHYNCCFWNWSYYLSCFSKNHKTNNKDDKGAIKQNVCTEKLSETIDINLRISDLSEKDVSIEELNESDSGQNSIISDISK